MIEDQRFLDDDRPEPIDPTVLLCGVPGIHTDPVADSEVGAVCHMQRLCVLI